MEETETDGLKPTELRTIGGGTISIVKAVSKEEGTNYDHRRKMTYITSNGEKIITWGAYDVLDFNEFRDTVADVTFRVLDEPSAGMWPFIAADLLCHAKLAVAQEEADKARAELEAETREEEAA